MKTGAPPIPLASVAMFPRALSAAALAIGALGVATTGAIAVGAGAGWLDAPRDGERIGLVVTFAASLFGLALGWLLPRLRVRPRDLFAHVQRPARWSPPAVLLALVSGALPAVAAAGALCGWGSRAMIMTAVNCGIVAAIAGGIGLVRRHLHRQAIAVFALYAEGALDPADARAIDAARAMDPAFDAAVLEHQRITGLVAEQLGRTGA
jgi:hypothetical protein